MDPRKRLVSEVMQAEVATLAPAERLDLVEDVMRLGRIRHMPVLDEGRVVGLVSNRDLLAASLTRSIEFEASSKRTFLRSVEVAEAMSRDLVTQAHPRRASCSDPTGEGGCSGSVGSNRAQVRGGRAEASTRLKADRRAAARGRPRAASRDPRRLPSHSADALSTPDTADDLSVGPRLRNFSPVWCSRLGRIAPAGSRAVFPIIGGGSVLGSR